jgi:hypothetical protein
MLETKASKWGNYRSPWGENRSIKRLMCDSCLCKTQLQRCFCRKILMIFRENNTVNNFQTKWISVWLRDCKTEWLIYWLIKQLTNWRIPSSVILRSVALSRTDVSEEHNVTIIRVTRLGELRTLAVPSNPSTLRRNTIWERKHYYRIQEWGWGECMGKQVVTWVLREMLMATLQSEIPYIWRRELFAV